MVDLKLQSVFCIVGTFAVRIDVGFLEGASLCALQRSLGSMSYGFT